MEEIIGFDGSFILFVETENYFGPTFSNIFISLRRASFNLVYKMPNTEYRTTTSKNTERRNDDQSGQQNPERYNTLTYFNTIIANRRLPSLFVTSQTNS